MPGIDPKSISVLKEAKSGADVYFAMVVKSPSVGRMVLNKTSHVPEDKITEAKKSCGSNTVVKGRCQGNNGTLTFQTVKPADTTAETLAKKLVKDAGVTAHCEFTTNAEAENDKPHTGGSSTGGTSTVGSTTGQKVGATTPVETGHENRSEELKHRLTVVLEWLKKAKAKEEMAGTVQRSLPVAQQANEALKTGDLVEAEKKIAMLENYLNLDSSRGEEQPETPPSNGKSEEIKHRLGVILEWLKEKKGDESMQSTVQRSVTVAQQVNASLKTGDLVEAEKKLVMLENYLNLDSSEPKTGPKKPSTPPPPRPGAQNYQRAKLGLDNFKLNPDAGWNTDEAKESIRSIRGNLLNLISGERAAEDDISRKGVLFDSKDAGYKKNVTDVVTKTMFDIEKVMTDPTKDTGGEIQKVNDAIDLLAVERAHYADVRGIKDSKMLDQRRRKVEAIDKHIGEMKKINGKLRDVLKLKMKPALDLLTSLPGLLEQGDPQESENALKEFAKTLSENEQLRKDLFQSVGPEQCDALCKFLTAQPQTENDKWCRELALTRAADPEFMDPLCKTAILAEASKYDQGTFFRQNSTASKLATNYAQNSPGGKAYCQSAHERYSKLAKGKGTLELDRSKDPNLSDKDLQKNAQAQTAMLGDVIDDMTQDPESVPPEIAKICNTFYEEAKRVSGGDEEFATTQSGGFLMLRCVIPSMMSANALEVNAIEDRYSEVKRQAKDKWVKSGKNAKDFVPPEMSRSDKSEIAKLQEKQRLVTLQTKVLQNISNGVEAGEKEAYMVPMNGAIKKDGNYTPIAGKLRGFLKGIATRGGQK